MAKFASLRDRLTRLVTINEVTKKAINPTISSSASTRNEKRGSAKKKFKEPRAKSENAADRTGLPINDSNVIKVKKAKAVVKKGNPSRKHAKVSAARAAIPHRNRPAKRHNSAV